MNYPKTNYDIKHVEAVAKRKLLIGLSVYLLLILIMAAGILSIVFLSDHVIAFIGGGAAVVISAVMLTKRVKRIDLSTLRTSVGRISDIDVQIRTLRHIAGGIGLHERRYDTYKKQTTSIGVFIDEGERVTPYYIHPVTNDQVEYYRCNARAIHIFATRFPIKTDDLSEEWFCSVCKTKNSGGTAACTSCRCHRSDKWLCPICGGFNEKEDISCVSCKTRIMIKPAPTEEKA